MLDFLLNNGVPSGLKYGATTAVVVASALALAWFYMMYDCIKHEKDRKIQALWLAVLLVGKFIAVFVYFAAVFLPRVRQGKAES